MTAITQNLPWFVKDLGVSIVGQECYSSLVENLHLGDVKCLKYSLSKGLGIGIVVGGSIMKVPQILLITNARSARGLSLPAYVLETLSYGITLAYSVRHKFPFSTYGENFFLTIQNVFITLLIIHYAPSRLTQPRSGSRGLLGALIATLVAAVTLYVIPTKTLSLLQLTTLPLSLFSKLPQIRQNYRAKSTGQLSAFAVISQIAGCLARVFTTSQEVGDIIVLSGFLLALALNLVLGAQLWAYWGQGQGIHGHASHGSHSLSSHRQNGIELKERAYALSDEPTSGGVSTPPSWQSQTQAGTIYQPTPSRPGAGPRLETPSPRTPSSAGGRKWSRKVD